jgi:hypothetical protein
MAGGANVTRLSDFAVLADLHTLLDAMVPVVEVQAGKPIPPGEAWRNDAQVMAVKLFRHLQTLVRLCDVTRVAVPGGHEIAYVDHASANVVARAALETLLVFSHVYGAEDQSRAVFRHSAWRLAGLTDRQQVKAVGSEPIRKLKDELATIEQLRDSIGSSSHFAALTPKHQKAILRGDWRYGLSWSDLGVAAGFGRVYFANAYNYLCGHSHSSWASVLQVRDAMQSISDQRSLTGSLTGLGAMTVALFMQSYCRLFPAGRDRLLKDGTGQFLVNRWGALARDLGEFYERPR